MRLLEVEPALTEGLAAAREEEARERILVETMALPSGPWEPAKVDVDGHLGYLVLEGLLIREVHVGESRSVELLNFGDIVRPWQEDPSLYSTSNWSALENTRLAILDGEAAELIAEYPPLVAVLVERAMCRARNLAVHWAIANTVGLEKRILMLFRHLAERWGRVTPDGVALPLRLTHQMVADLVGARRPSATTAIVRLADQDLLKRSPDGGWLLSSGSADLGNAA